MTSITNPLRHRPGNTIEGINWAVAEAAKAQVMLSMEIMDTAFMSNIRAGWISNGRLGIRFCVYPDVGNLSAWQNDVPEELSKGIHKISAIHLKDTQPVSHASLGQFRDVPVRHRLRGFQRDLPFACRAELSRRMVD